MKDFFAAFPDLHDRVDLQLQWRWELSDQLLIIMHLHQKLKFPGPRKWRRKRPETAIKR